MSGWFEQDRHDLKVMILAQSLSRSRQYLKSSGIPEAEGTQYCVVNPQVFSVLPFIPHREAMQVKQYLKAV